MGTDRLWREHELVDDRCPWCGCDVFPPRYAVVPTTHWICRAYLRTTQQEAIHLILDARARLSA